MGISLRAALFAIIIGILLGSLFVFILITRNLILARIMIPIYVIIMLSIVLLGLSSEEITEFQPSLKELYRKLFKDTPYSYVTLGIVILGFAVGIFGIFAIFFCDEWNNLCDIIFIIFSIFGFLGLILMAIGLILTLRKGR